MKLIEMYDDIMNKGHEQKASSVGTLVIFTSLVSAIILGIVLFKSFIAWDMSLVTVRMIIILTFIVWLPKLLPESIMFRKDEV